MSKIQLREQLAATHVVSSSKPDRVVSPFKRDNHSVQQEIHMRGILLWLIGLPIPIIILLYLFNVL